MDNPMNHIPDVPTWDRLPGDSRAAWVNGWNAAVQIYQEMFSELQPFMDSTVKAKILNLHRPKKKKRPKPTKPNPNNCEIHPAHYMSAGVCTLCRRVSNYG